MAHPHAPPAPKPAAWPRPGFEQLAPDERFAEVTRRLKALHPKWSGEGTLHAEERFARVDGRYLEDLSPIAALTWLEHLELTSTADDRELGARDLSGLRGLKLRDLKLEEFRSDLHWPSATSKDHGRAGTAGTRGRVRGVHYTRP